MASSGFWSGGSRGLAPERDGLLLTLAAPSWLVLRLCRRRLNQGFLYSKIDEWQGVVPEFSVLMSTFCTFSLQH